MAKKQQATTRERASKAARGVSGTRAAVAGASILGGIAIGAALFGGWRKSPGETGGSDAEIDLTGASAVNNPISDANPIAPVDLAAAEADAFAADDDAEKLHAMGTPTTLPIDDAPQSYTGDGEPDMSVDYIPGEDPGSIDAADTRSR